MAIDKFKYNPLYFDPRTTWSYNAIYNEIYGGRGTGKTFNTLGWAIERWIKTRHTDKPSGIVYLRRYTTELERLTKNPDKGTAKLFDDIIAKGMFAGHELKAENDILYCDDEMMGIALALTDQSILKSIPFPDARVGIFEEFVTIDRFRGYLPHEVEVFLELDSTIDRNRDQLRWFMLGNKCDAINPYMTYWNHDMPFNKERELFGNDNQILVEDVKNEQFVEMVKQTRRGKLLKETNYGRYAYDNESLRSNTNFIGKKPYTCEYKFTLVYYYQKLGIWYDVRNGRYYISHDVNEECPITYCATTEDMQPNTMLFLKNNRSPFIQRLMRAYECGCVYYEDMKLKSWFRDIVKMRS